MNLFFIRNKIVLSFIFSMIVFVSILVIFILFIQAQVYSARFFIMNYLESKTGFKIKYDKIAPYFLSSIKIDNLELSLNDKDTILMNTVKVNLDLFKLLLGDKNIILDIFVRGSTLNFDLNDFKFLDPQSAHSRTLKLDDDSTNHAIFGKMFNFFDSLHMHLEDINMNFKLSSDKFLKFQIKSFALKTIDDDFLFSFIVDFSSLAVLNPNVSHKNILDSTFYFEGKFRKELEDGYINFSFLKLHTSYFDLLEQGFQINYSKGNIEIFNILRENLDFNLKYDFNKKFLRLDALFFDVNLVNWISFNENLSDYKDYLDTNLNGQLAFSYDFKDKDLRYAFLLNSSSNANMVNKEIQGLKVQIKGNEAVVDVQNAFVKLKRGFIGYKGYYSLKDLVPIGRLDFRSAKIFNFKDINGHLNFSKRNQKFCVKSDDFRVGRLKIRDLNMKTSFAQDRIYVNYLLSFANNNSKISLKGDFNKENFNLNLGVKEFPMLFLKDVLPETFITKVIPEYFLSGKYLNLTSDFDLNTVNYTKSKLNSLNFVVLSKLDDFNLMFNASGEKNIYTVNYFNYSNGDYNVNSNFLIQLFDDSFKINTEFNYLNRNYPLYFELNFKDRYANLKLSPRSKVSLTYSDSSIVYFFDINDFCLYNGDSEILLNVNSLGNYQRMNDDLNVKITKFKLGKIAGNPAYNFNFSFEGLYKDKQVSLSNIRFINGVSNLQGQGHFNLNDKLSGNLNLFSHVNSERYFFGVDSNEDGSYFVGRFQGFNFNNLKFFSFLNGNINGNFILSFKDSDLFNYSLSAYLETNDLSLVGVPTYCSLNLGLVDNNLNIYNIKASQNEREILTGNFRYDIKNSIGISNLNVNSKLFSSSVNASFQKFENKTEEEFGILKSETDGEIALRGLRYKDKDLSDLTIEFKSNPERFIMSSIEYDLFSCLYEYNDGNFDIRLNDYLPFSFVASGNIFGDKITSNIQDIKFDSKLITKDLLGSKTFFNIKDHFVLYDLNVIGRLDVDGDLYNPNLNGEFEVVHGLVSSEYLKMSRQYGKSRILELINVPVIIKDNNVIIENKFNLDYYSDVNVAAHLNLNFLSDSIVDYYKVDIGVSGSSGVPIKFDKVTINFVGHASGDFFIEGNSEEIMFRGELNVSNAWIYLLENSIVDLLIDPYKRSKKVGASDVSSKGLDVVTDLKINFDSNVAFHWPDNKISFLNAIIARGNKLEIKSDTKTDDFILKGDLNVASGSFNYHNKQFVFRGGSYISFNENKNKFDPWVKAEATNVIKDGNENLLITMSIDGPLSLWNLSFSSYPVRTEQEIKYLLSSAIIGGEHGLQSAGTNTAEMALGLASDILVDLIVQPIEDYIRSVLKLDLLSIKTDILRNAIGILGSTTTFAGVLDKTNVKVGKYIIDGVFAKAGFGFLKEEVTPLSQNLNFSINFGLELDSPFFFVDYIFDYNFMKYGHGIGNQISIFWKFKY
ncbi:translocation/assembly module TamB domain-containing protein [Borrelia venezuelensis]|uniref:translocation/assembly module TamB domain-containing protein n=1 Tax=Borrelia venezuelensis TaxID=1653839 RepID=UPI001FF2E476|nr:translocation/assembly module TamB domain-containing protein [Borrelia venezuelensis]UPA12436.1 translocation/assembly module TamB domain-containing protein [Borrelia venezuelensis]